MTDRNPTFEAVLLGFNNPENNYDILLNGKFAVVHVDYHGNGVFSLHMAGDENDDPFIIDDLEDVKMVAGIPTYTDEHGTVTSFSISKAIRVRGIK